MRNFNHRSNASNSGRSQGGYRNDQRGSDRPRYDARYSDRNQMYDAVCADCGNNCKVPFMPSNGKPVFCSDCFENRGNGGRDSRGSRDSRSANFSNDRRFSNRNESFSKDTSRDSRPQENYTKQFQTINSKLDIIISLLSSEDKKVVEKTIDVSQEVAEIMEKVEKKAKAPAKKAKAPAKKKVAAKKVAKA